MFDYYIYIYLNPLKKGNYIYGKFNFNHEPFYIGKGKLNRYKNHLLKSNEQNKLKQNIINKIKKDNKEPIIIKLYDNITENSAFRLEKYLINLIGRRYRNKGTLSNLTDGGEGTSGRIYSKKNRNRMIKNENKIIQYNNEGKIINIWDNIIDLSLKYPYLLTNHIHRACKSNGHRKIDNYFWKYYENEKITDIIVVLDKYKSVLQYDLNGNFLKEWDCSSDVNKNGFSSGAVLKCCRNNQNNKLLFKFKDYMWFFKYNNYPHKIGSYINNKAFGNSKLESRKIKQYTIDNKYIDTFNSKELKKKGFNNKTIYRCCNGKLKTTQGFKWKWE